MTFRNAWPAFVGGQIGEGLEFRSDLSDLYSKSVRRAENVLVTPQGPLPARPGLKRVVQWDQARRVVPFVFSTVQAYLFAFGDGTCKVFMNDVEQASFSIPWIDADLPKVRFTQSFDTWTGFHPNYEPRQIVRGGSHTSWSINPVAFVIPGTYRFGDVGSTTITPSAVSGAVTLTASASLFTASWVGVFIRINEGYVKITGYTNATTVSGTVIGTNLSGTTASSVWEESAWSSLRGWPVTGTYHQNRLIIAGTRDLPQTVFGSRIGLYNDFNVKAAGSGTSTTVKDDDSFQYTLASSDVNAIQEVYSIRNALQIFTSSAEWIETSAPLTPSNVSFKLSTRHGMSQNGIRTVSIDSDNLFVDRTGKQLRAFSYNFNTDAYTARSLTVAAPDVIYNPIECVYLRGFAGTQANHALFLNPDGSIAVLALDTDQKILGWTRFIFNGHTPRAMTALVDDLYVITEYNSHRYICKLTTDAYMDLWHSGSSGSPTKNWSGATAFANQTVYVEGDGYTFPDIHVDGSGNFTLSFAVSNVQVGLPYTKLIETLPLAPVINATLMRGDRIRLIKATATVRNTRDLWINGRQVPLRNLGEQLLDQPITEKDATYSMLISGTGPEPTVTIESRLTKAFMLIGLIVEFKCKVPSQ